MVSTNKFFKLHDRPSAWLADKPDTERPQIPAATRWDSQRAALKSFKRNHLAMNTVVSEHPSYEWGKVKEILRDHDFYDNVSDNH